MRVINNYRMDSNEGGEGSSITSKRRRHRRSCLLACFACLQTSLQEDDDDDDDERDRRATSCRAIYFPISLPASSKPSVKQAAYILLISTSLSVINHCHPFILDRVILMAVRMHIVIGTYRIQAKQIRIFPTLRITFTRPDDDEDIVLHMEGRINDVDMVSEQNIDEWMEQMRQSFESLYALALLPF